MKLLSSVKHFHSDEGGAVTVDWVVLTGGVLILGALTAGFIARGATDTSEGVGGVLSSAEVPTVEFDGP